VHPCLPVYGDTDRRGPRHVAVGFNADIAVAINGREADAKSLLAILALGAEGGSELRLTASGDDAPLALDALRDCVAAFD